MNSSSITRNVRKLQTTAVIQRCLHIQSPALTPLRPFRSLRRNFSSSSIRGQKQAADDPNFTSVIDNPPVLVRVGRKHTWGILVLGISPPFYFSLFHPPPSLQALDHVSFKLSRAKFSNTQLTLCLQAAIPLTAFLLGTWQVKRLTWKTNLLAKLEDRILREPLPLPPKIDPDALEEFDYRRVYAMGHFRHDQEMLIGPRMRDGQNGYFVITPLERNGEGEEGTTILVNRGWISKKMASQRRRPEGLPRGKVTVEGLLRKPFRKNMFTPDNRPDKGEFYFPDVQQMASLTGSQPVWVEATMGISLQPWPTYHLLPPNPAIDEC
jgi:surfeit locus 1 family protein